MPEVGDWFDKGILPREVFTEFGKLGFLGAHLEGYGCSGVNAVSYGLINHELEYGDSGLRSAVSVQGSLAMYAIYRWGSEEQKQEWLPRMAAGEAIGCFGLTEADAGSAADVAIVWAATDDGIRGFLLEKGMPGFTAPDIHKKMSLRASITSELVFQDVRVPDANRLPEANSLRGPLSCLNEARYGIGWGVMGAARACYEEALSYATERIVFEKPLTSYQLTQQKLAEMVLEINRGMLMSLHLGRMKDAGTLRPEHVSLGKMGNARGALDIARSARSILGGNGITLEYPVIRHMNNLESVVTYEGTHEVHTLVVGGAVTGIQAFR